MALPSKKQQIAAVMRYLDADENEGKDLEEVATSIVNGYLAAISPAQAPLPLREGMLLKTPLSNKVYRVVWLNEGLVWVVGETGGYGWLGPEGEEFWSFCEEYRPKTRVQVDGKNKMVEMTDEQIAEAWSNPDHQVGDQVSWRQRQYIYEIIATAPQSVLMRNVKTGALSVDSNNNIAKYFKREVKGAAEW
jgi:hypothetical protein